MADIETIKVSQQSIVVPEHVEYPEGRITIDSGSILAKNYKVRVEVKVIDDAGVDKSTTVQCFVFKDMPVNATKEIVGVVRVSFAESTKPVV